MLRDNPARVPHLLSPHSLLSLHSREAMLHNERGHRNKPRHATRVAPLTTSRERLLAARMTQRRQSKLKAAAGGRGQCFRSLLFFKKKKGIRPNSQTLELLQNVKLLYDKI